MQEDMPSIYVIARTPSTVPAQKERRGTYMNGISFLRDNLNLQAYSLEDIAFKELRFEGGESYRGGWRDDVPEGEGIYSWSDGSVYEGSWHEGLKHGWGKYTWPNGAQYKGEWHKGLLQGYGNFRSPDGSHYQGGWSANLKHGLGKKTYANGDFYEGLWRHGKAEGPGRYVWQQGNVYDGEWRCGKMHGQGTLRWSTGERYDGEWREGLEDGIGVFTWQDGSTYEGFWVQGKKEGVGVFRPAIANRLAHPPNEALPSSDGFDAAELVEPQSSIATFEHPIDSPTVARGPLTRDGHFADAARKNAGSDLVYVCEYRTGRLLHEEALSSQDLEVVFGPLQQQFQRKRRLRRRGKRRQESMGETIYKGHRSYDLMLNLQLGIRYTLTTLSKVPRPSQIKEANFHQKVWLRFPRNGSEVTPPHPSNDFKWKDYCPEAFRKLRDIFGINTSEYLLSICGDQALRELPSPGKSGSVFFISHDDQYMIKTMRKEEIKLLLTMLPRYLAHVSANPSTLLLRFFGVHRVKPSHGLKVRFVVMNNVFRTDVPLHRKYDLKGSTLGRTIGAKMSATAIRKDLDLDVKFKVDPLHRTRLLDQMRADCGFLEDSRVMDYSLLLGVHYRSFGDTSASPVNTDKEDDGDATYETAEEEDGGGGGIMQRLSSDQSPRLGTLGRGAVQLQATPAAAADLPPLAENAVSGATFMHRRSASDAGVLRLPTGDEVEDVDRAIVSSIRTTRMELLAKPVQEGQAERSSGSLGFLSKLLRSKDKPQEQQQQQELTSTTAKGLDSGKSLAALPRSPTSPHKLIAQLEQPLAADVVQPLHIAAEQPLMSRSSPGTGSPGKPAAGTREPQQHQDQQQEPAASATVTSSSTQHQPRQPLPAAPTSEGQMGQQQQQGGPQLQQSREGLASTRSLDVASGDDRIAASTAAAPFETAGSQHVQSSSAPPTSYLQQWQQRRTSDGAQEQQGLPATDPTAAVEAVPDQERPCPTGCLAEGHEPLPSEEPAAEQLTPRELVRWRSDAVCLHDILRAPAVQEPQELMRRGSLDRRSQQHGQPPGQQHQRSSSAGARLSINQGGNSSGSFTSAASVLATLPSIPPQGSLPPPSAAPPGSLPPYAAPPSTGSHSEAQNGWHQQQLLIQQQQQQQRGRQHRAPSPSRFAAEAASRAGSATVAPLAGVARRHTMPVLIPKVGDSDEAEQVAVGNGSPVEGMVRVSVSRLSSDPGPGYGPLGRASSAPASSFEAYASAGVRLRGGAAGLLKSGPGMFDGPASFKRMATTGARVSGGLLRRPDSVVDLTTPENQQLVSRIRKKLERPVSDRLLQDLLKLARYRMLGKSAGNRHFRAPTMVLAARSRRSSGLFGRYASEDDAPTAVAQEQHPGLNLHAVAVSMQAAQQPEEVVLFCGIIDFLQEYNLRKMLEHNFKAVVQDGKAISVVEPRAYSKRFLQFMSSVFVD
ncbi:hypothetical protein N2152v2_000539 [Parachlorella kessleri]